jgi:hypothetical protein
MFFLLRVAFWLGVVCVLLPSSDPKGSSEGAQVDATEAVTLASAAVSDARGFCDRQPNACEVGGKVAIALGRRAESGARTLYGFFNATTASKLPEPAETKSGKEMSGRGASVALKQGTLTAADVKAEWHAPVPLPPRSPTP